MSKIETLTSEQIARLPEYVQKWTDIGLSTEPINRQHVKEAIIACFKQVDKLPPKHFIYLRSPLEVCAAIALLQSDSVNASVLESVRDSISYNVVDSVLESVHANTSSGVRNKVLDSFIICVPSSVSACVRDSIRANVSRTTNWDYWWRFGQFANFYAAYYDFMENVVQIPVDFSPVHPNVELTKSAGWTVLFWDYAFISERPSVINRDEQGRPHSLSGPAIAYEGFSVHAVHGVRVPEHIEIRA